MVLAKTLESPLYCRSNQSILKEINPEYLLEGLMLKLKPILWHSACCIVQISYPYMTTGKTITLTRWAFVGKVKSLLFNMLYSLVIAFFPRNKCLNFKASVTNCSDFGAQENKVSHCFHCFPIYLP